MQKLQDQRNPIYPAIAEVCDLSTCKIVGLCDRQGVLVHVVFIAFVDIAWLRVAMVPCGLVPEALELGDKDT